MAIKYRTLQKASVGERFPFSWLVFNSWDFAITKPATATSKMLDITISLKVWATNMILPPSIVLTALQETLAETRQTVEHKLKIGVMLMRVCTNLLIFITLAGTSYAIYLAVDNAEAKVHRRDFHGAFNSGTQGLVLFLASFQVQGVVTARNLALPYMFQMAEWLENFHPRTALKMRLFRLFLLYLSSLYVLIISLFSLSSQCGGGGGGEDGRGCCWENNIGQELFKLNLTHLLADTATMTVDVSRWVLPKIPHMGKLGKLAEMIGPTEFRLADNVLKLIYGQALVLLGVLFCPLLPLIGLVKYIFIFYCRSVVVYYCNQPPRNVFRVSSTLNFYLGILLATALLCSFPVGYAMFSISPSNTCGPFRGLENMLYILLDDIDTWPQVLQIAIDNMRTATVIVPILALLGLQIYYYAVMSSALKEVNKDLKLQLRMEHADIREKLAQFRQPPPLAFGAPGQRHLQLQQALESQQISERRLSLHQNPMMAEPDTPHHHHTSHPPPSHHPHQQPSHPHTNGLLDQNEQQQTPVVKPPPMLASSHTHH
ncbi:Transmembrane channel-like protein 3 [Geodia barretti]|uniref:Transmembrane channel-like protein 3 n=2 Tax=Geodia barretti TaxID=519541 RepID=A0AA35T129_GEOBA|nr:Transmembrane channel-like protein 3 [Geodia barretti]